MQNRVGGPEIGLLADAGLATLMGDSPNGLGSTLAKLQNKSAMSHNHRQLLDAFRKSSRIGSMLSLPRSITDRSDELYKRVLESKTVRHRGSDALMAACIFMVCKAEGVPRTIKGQPAAAVDSREAQSLRSGSVVCDALLTICCSLLCLYLSAFAAVFARDVWCVRCVCEGFG